jgi:hypothetical protein
MKLRTGYGATKAYGSNAWSSIVLTAATAPGRPSPRSVNNRLVCGRFAQVTRLNAEVIGDQVAHDGEHHSR